jgi:hypothetical protein
LSSTSSDMEVLEDMTRRIRFDDPCPQYIDDKRAVRVLPLAKQTSTTQGVESIPALQSPAKGLVRAFMTLLLPS